MPPQVATLVFACLVAALYFLDREKNAEKTSPAVWIAVLWVAIGSSRMVSQWLQLQAPDAADIYIEGSPVDRNILAALTVAGLLVLIRRGRRTTDILRSNMPLVLFFGYCAATVLWSDFPFVTFKRWTKALGNVTVVLLILSDPSPATAIRRLFAWTGFLLIPLSVLLIKYYPEIGRGYSSWTWETYYVGVATSKNGLGNLCMIFGMVALWRVVTLHRAKVVSEHLGTLVAQSALLIMAFWLFLRADSATSTACFMLGALVMLLVSRQQHRTPRSFHRLMGALAGLGLLTYIFPSFSEIVLNVLGRNPTLTGRTELWSDVLTMDFNPWLGTAFETFWVGPRLDELWSKYTFRPNQSHNGFIEMYLNLGVVGLVFFALLLWSGYKNVLRTYRHDPVFGSLSVSLFVVAIAYNFTEAAFKSMSPVWICFMLAISLVPSVVPGVEASTVPSSDRTHRRHAALVCSPRRSLRLTAGNTTIGVTRTRLSQVARLAKPRRKRTSGEIARHGSGFSSRAD